MPGTSYMRHNASIDRKLTDEYGTIDALIEGNSPQDSAKTSPNFRRLSVDRSLSQHQSSHEFRKCPDFYRCDCKLVITC